VPITAIPRGLRGDEECFRALSGTRTDIDVLLITANPQGARAIGKALAKRRGDSFQVRHMSRLPKDLAWLRAGASDVILLDLALPDLQAISPLSRLLAAAPQLPILVFGGADGDNRARRAVARGAADHLPRSQLDSYSLTRALRSVVGRKATEEALFLETQRAQVTLDAIGDAVLSVDVAGRVLCVNSVAERMTGWTREEAKGQPLEEVFRIVDETTRAPPARNPMLAVERDEAVGLAADSVLLRRDGVHTPIEDSALPIHGAGGDMMGTVIVFRDVGDSPEAKARMSHLAQHDFLTGLPNPVLLNDRITQAIALARRNANQLAVLFMDLDGFKSINDALGHDVGDELLQSVARRLEACVRGSDSVSRRGGDEFVVLLSQIAHAEHAAQSAAKIIAAVAAAHRIGGNERTVTASIGIATYPQDGADAETLLKAADVAMYQAKAGGRNQYRFFGPAMAIGRAGRPLLPPAGVTPWPLGPRPRGRAAGRQGPC
jgi:diguanylate cyclase (GGDEF)-like protein/PAS domain S-box-containing protein